MSIKDGYIRKLGNTPLRLFHYCLPVLPKRKPQSWMQSYLELGFLVGAWFISTVVGSPWPGKVRHEYLRKEKGEEGGKRGGWKEGREGGKSLRNNFLQLILSATIVAASNKSSLFSQTFLQSNRLTLDKEWCPRVTLTHLRKDLFYLQQNWSLKKSVQQIQSETTQRLTS